MDSRNPRGGGASSGGDGRPTLKTIAFMTGLGVTTVSRALKDAPEIGEATKRRVQLVAQQVGYRPNRAGVRLRTGKTNVISLVLNTEEQIMGFVSDIIYGISEVLAQTPYHLIVTPYARTNDPMDPVRYIVETGSADGIIISKTEPDDPRVRYMTERGFPFATHGRTDMGIAHPFHDFDNHTFALEAVRALASKGRRKLALLGPPSPLSYHHHTLNGFSDGLIETGATAIPFNAVSIDNTIEQIRTQTVQLMQRRDRPDGLVSSAAAATLALVGGIEDAGLTVGREIDIASKQSTKLLHLFRPSILVVNEDFRLAGRELARSVLGWIDGADPAALQSLSVPTGVESFAPAAGDRGMAVVSGA
jgi:LacI family transcriptional regulator